MNFVRRDAALALHDRAVEAFGGLAGVRDPGLLDSALARPMNLLAYAPEGAVDLYDLASAYAFAVAKNHAFHDGNRADGLGHVRPVPGGERRFDQGGCRGCSRTHGGFAIGQPGQGRLHWLVEKPGDSVTCRVKATVRP